MRLSQYEIGGETEIDLRPMIGVVIALIVSIWILTDITHQTFEGEDGAHIEPVVQGKQASGPVRPILNLPHSYARSIVETSEHDPQVDDDDMSRLERYLEFQARKFRKSDDVSAHAIACWSPTLGCAEAHVEFRYIQRVKKICDERGIQIWKFDSPGNEIMRLDRYLHDQAEHRTWTYAEEVRAKWHDNSLMNRADAYADEYYEFKYIQRVMKLCGKRGSQAW